MNSINFTINLFVSRTSVCLLALLLTTVQLVIGHPCLEAKCNCLWINNKLSADCSLRKLSTLPHQDSDSPDVQAINLTRNNIFELKRNIFSESNLVNLQKITLQKVGLERVDEKAFNELKNLVFLDLSYNSLKYIPSQSFYSVLKLRILDLSSNLIPSVPEFSFKNLTNLKTLSLERNRITFIDDNAFIGLVNLETLKLSENSLTTIRSQSLLPLNNVHSLTLSGNQWKCDCSMRSVRKYLLANPRINVADGPKCANSDEHVWTILGLDSFLCRPVISNLSSSPNPTVNEGTVLQLQCVVELTDDEDHQQLSIQWRWKNVLITNSSKGCGTDCQTKNASQQYFYIYENINNKTKISRLDLSSVQPINSGSYLCIAQNKAGTAQRVFNVGVTITDPKKSTTAAVASSDSQSENDNKPKEEQTNKVVIGLILGIIFGILLVLVVLGISIILLCRRRRRKPTNIPRNSMSDETELEKLTTNSNSALKVNPIQKPPRLQLNTKYNLEKDMPEVWLIKHNINGNSNLIRDPTYAESDYSTQLLFNDNYNDSQNISDFMNEPDVIHPSAYVRERHIQVTDLDQLSIHSDGTEV